MINVINNRVNAEIFIAIIYKYSDALAGRLLQKQHKLYHFVCVESLNNHI